MKTQILNINPLASDFTASLKYRKSWKLKTEFTNASVYETFRFGKLLLLDNVINSAESDEYIYHQGIIEGFTYKSPKPKSALILGGGNGGCIREIKSRWKNCKITLVDIDKELSQWINKLFTNNYSAEIWDNVETHWECITSFLKHDHRSWDIIINDMVDPLPQYKQLHKNWKHIIEECIKRSNIGYCEQLGHPNLSKLHGIKATKREFTMKITKQIPSFFGPFEFGVILKNP